MIRKYRLNEDVEPIRFPISYSENMMNKIDEIIDYNKFNKEGIKRWGEYIDWLAKYVSQWKVSLLYGRNYTIDKDDVFYINEVETSIIFIDSNHIEIVNAELFPEDYGLEIPPHLREAEIKLINVISEAVRQALRDVLIEKTLSEHRSTVRRRQNRVRTL